MTGRPAATWHGAFEELLPLGKDIEARRDDRFVDDGEVITAAGVSAGIDMGLTLAARIAGDEFSQAIQLGIEYDPQPPFDSGALDKAPQQAVERLAAMYAERL